MLTAGEVDQQDIGKIKWLPGKSTFEIKYMDKGGKLKTTTRHLHVANHQASGQPLSTDELREARQKMLLQARMMWNRLDQSDAERITR